MKFFILTVVVVCLPMAAYAQNDPSQDVLCKMVQAHKPKDDVAYKAGVDVNGNEVVSADIGGSASAYKFPSNVNIPISIDIAERLNADVEGLESFGQFGVVEIKNGNEVFFQGQNITQQAHTLCDIAPAQKIAPVVLTKAEPTIKAAPVITELPKVEESLPAYKAPLVIKEKIVQAPKVEIEIIEDKPLFGGYSQDTVNKYND